MKNLILFILCSVVGFAQAPQGISHRGTAYNVNGTILQNTPIILKAQILNGSGGTVAYTETHNLTTNNSGQYNINIGQGTNPSVLFSSISWSSGDKWLKIEIAPASSPTNFVTGTSQLMSVPYAFYSNNTNQNNSLRVVNKIDDLRNVIGSLGDVIYIKGHTITGDGGDGNFIWSNHPFFINSTINVTLNNIPNQSINSPYFNDNDGTVIKAKNPDGTLNNSGRWIRQFNGFIDVRFFGATGQYSIDSTLKIQTAIDFAYSNASIGDTPLKGTSVFLPNGGYVVNKLILKNGVSLIGDSMDKTYITSSNSSYPGYTNDGYLIEIDKGPVQINLSNINFIGNNTEKGCFYLNAKYDSNTNSGGIWYSTFKNIKITNFKGNGIYLKGGGESGDSYLLPNQFLIFENVRVTRIKNESNALNITGLSGQLTFLNCQFDGSKINCNGNPETCSRNQGSNVEILNNVDKASSVISFINTTFQDSDVGLSINSATNITIDNCWFESLGISIKVTGLYNECNSINILNNLFTNAAGFGYQSPQGNIQKGKCIDVTNSNVNISNNFTRVSILNPQSMDDYFLTSDDNSSINLSNNSFLSPELGKTNGQYQTASISSKTINIKNKKVVFVNVPSVYYSMTNDIDKILSSSNSGEIIFIRANGGSIKFLPMNSTTELNGRNIHLNGRTSLTLLNGQAATFIKIDNIVGNENCTYQLISVSN